MKLIYLWIRAHQVDIIKSECSPACLPDLIPWLSLHSCAVGWPPAGNESASSNGADLPSSSGLDLPEAVATAAPDVGQSAASQDVVAPQNGISAEQMRARLAMLRENPAAMAQMRTALAHMTPEQLQAMVIAFMALSLRMRSLHAV
jgi:hypothetical protein